MWEESQDDELGFASFNMLTFGNVERYTATGLRTYSVTVDGVEAIGDGSISLGQNFYDKGSSGYYTSAYLTEISKICVFAINLVANVGEENFQFYKCTDDAEIIGNKDYGFSLFHRDDRYLIIFSS